MAGLTIGDWVEFVYFPVTDTGSTQPAKQFGKIIQINTYGLHFIQPLGYAEGQYYKRHGHELRVPSEEELMVHWMEW